MGHIAALLMYFVDVKCFASSAFLVYSGYVVNCYSYIFFLVLVACTYSHRLNSHFLDEPGLGSRSEFFIYPGHQIC